MASSPDFVTYICEQLGDIGAVRSRKMFGEYMVYLNDKPVIMVCDDTVFVKMLPCLGNCWLTIPPDFPMRGRRSTMCWTPMTGTRCEKRRFWLRK